MERKKTTVYLDAELLTAAKMIAVSSGRKDYEVLEDALRGYLLAHRTESARARLSELLDSIAAKADLGDDDALKMAYAELDSARRDRARRAAD